MIVRIFLTLLSLFVAVHSSSIVVFSQANETEEAEVADEEISLEDEEDENSLESQLEDLPIPEGGINLTVSPITLVFEAEPGETVRSNVKIRNNGTETEYLQPEIATFDIDAQGNPQIRLFEANDPSQDWVSFDQELVEVKAGVWETITVEFAPPEEASLDYYYVLLFKRAVEEVEEGESLVSGAPAIFTLANVESANAIRELQLTEFSVPKVLFEFLPVPFQVKVKNTGNIFLAPTGNIFIDSQRKQDVAVLSINPTISYVIPDSERSYEPVWEDGFPLRIKKEIDGQEVKNDKGESVYELKWDFSQANKFRIGKYTANIIMVYDDGEKDVPFESSVSFWVVPWRMILIGILIPVVPAVLVFLIMRWAYGRKSG